MLYLLLRERAVLLQWSSLVPIGSMELNLSFFRRHMENFFKVALVGLDNQTCA